METGFFFIQSARKDIGVKNPPHSPPDYLMIGA